MARITLTVTAEENKPNAINYLRANVQEIVHQVNAQLAHEQYINAKRIAESAVDEFYGSYPPKAYSRTGDLYNAYDIGIRNDEDFTFQIGPDLMQHYHHQGNEFVFENSFKRGFHGGSMGKADIHGVVADVQRYRKPIGSYYEWGGQAAKTDPPYEKIMSEWTAYLSGEFESRKAEIIMNTISAFAAKCRR